MKIRELQQRIADALNGVETLVQGGCKALAEDALDIMHTVDAQLAQAGGVALVVTTPNVRRDGTDHRTHFFNDPKHPENIPLKTGDIDMLPSVWRNPEVVRKIQRDLYEFRVEAVDGGFFVLQVKVNNGIPTPWSYFRTTKEIAGGARMPPRAQSPLN